MTGRRLDDHLLEQARAAVVRAELARCARLRRAIAGDASVVDAHEHELAVRRLLRLDRPAVEQPVLAGLAGCDVAGDARLVLFAIAALASDGVAVVTDRMLARACRLPEGQVLEHVDELRAAGLLDVPDHDAGVPVYVLAAALTVGGRR